MDVYTAVAHTTAPRGNRREVQIPKSFLDAEGVFDVQRIATVASTKLIQVLNVLAERLGL